MASSTIFVCQQCGKTYSKWQGRCDNCDAWSSLVEDVVVTKRGSAKSSGSTTSPKPTLLTEINRQNSTRLLTGIKDFDQVLGGGIVPGSIILLGGEPGIGKSTLLLQTAAQISGTVYVTGEESLDQIGLRADRLGIRSDLSLIQETDADAVVAFIEHNKPKLVIIDSIQTMMSGDFPGVAGSIVQVRSCAQKFQMVAKSTGVPIILVGHVTKEGTIAGPRTMEHIVDVVLSFEGSMLENSRLLRGVKNRFGPTNEVGILAMAEKGLESVANPSALFLSEEESGIPGSAVTCLLEGRRPLLIEVQALTVPTTFGYPRRTAVGIDLNRLQILVAVLQRRADLKLESSDVYVNVVGGIRAHDPAIDLAVCLAIASSFFNKALPSKIVAIGEVGLLGEIRPVSRQSDRLNEAKKLGYSKTVVARHILDAIGKTLP